MSLHLCLVFDKYNSNNRSLLGHERLSLVFQDHSRFERLQSLAVRLDEALLWYGDKGIEHRRDDPYGTQLTWLPAAQLARELETWAIYLPWDAAVLAFVKALPPGTKIVLWWN